MDAAVDYLRDHRFKALFTELLGWEHASGSIRVSAGGRDFEFASIAHKRGLLVLHSSTASLALVNRSLLRKVQRIVARTCHENILIFSCDQPRKQVWQWAIRFPDGRKLRHREHQFFSNSPPELFLQRLAGLRFTLSEEADATLIEALDRVRSALDRLADLNLFVSRPWYAERSDELLKAMQNGDKESLHRFLRFHLPLARKFSKGLCHWFGIAPEDAEQFGFLGLMKAARRFRPELGFQFSTYATPCIKQVCARLGPDFAFLIHLPVNLFWRCFRLRLTLDRMLSGGVAGIREFLRDLDFRDPKLSEQLRDFDRATAVRSLSDRKQPEYRAALQIPESWSSPLDNLEYEEQAQCVQRAVSRLNSRQAQIIRLRYGFDGCPAQTLEVIASLYGLTRERVRQIQSKAEERLKAHLCREMEDMEHALTEPEVQAALASTKSGGYRPEKGKFIDDGTWLSNGPIHDTRRIAKPNCRSANSAKRAE